MSLDRSRVHDENELRLTWHEGDLAHALDVVGAGGIDGESVIAELVRFSVAAPSWAVGTAAPGFGGSRSAVSPARPRRRSTTSPPSTRSPARTAASRCTCPWDDPGDDAGALRVHAESQDLTFDAMNSNTFQDNPSTTDDGAVSYKFGSLCSTDPASSAPRSSTTATSSTSA
jgi:L-rhamnose isomerase/sugar isomerase